MGSIYLRYTEKMKLADGESLSTAVDMVMDDFKEIMTDYKDAPWLIEASEADGVATVVIIVGEGPNVAMSIHKQEPLFSRNTTVIWLMICILILCVLIYPWE